MSALMDVASRGDVAEVRRSLREGASLRELGVNGKTAMYMAVDWGRNPVVKCLIKEGGADIDAVITAGNTKHTVLSIAALNGIYVLAQWLIEEGALIPTDIWKNLGNIYQLEDEDAAEFSSLLKVLTLLPMSPAHDHHLPDFCR
jgi:ankyrin repeat protein